jgi:GNAT superfamily N-acetyltransferase
VRAAGREILTVTGERAATGPESATGFATRHGFTAALGAQHSMLRLPDDDAGLEALLAPIEAEVERAGAAERYHLVSYLDAVPAQWIDQRAVLAGRMSTDAPLDDLELEPELWDAERLREKDQMMLDQGRRAVETVAVERSTGVMAGATTVVHTPEHGDISYQWDSLVLAEHRGHRLGMWLKAANLRVLLEAFPVVRRVSTYNAQSNEPMLRVNRAFGFEEVGGMAEARVKPVAAQRLQWCVEQVDLLGEGTPDGVGHGADAADWYAVMRASWDEGYGERSHPWTLHEIRCWVRGDSSSRYLHLLARDGDGRVAGAAQLSFPLRDNTFQAFAELEVAPGCRRGDAGSALLDGLESLVRADGRTTLTVESGRALHLPDVAGSFAQRHGFAAALVSSRNDLDLPVILAADAGPAVALDAVLAPIDAEIAQANPAAEYHLVTYWDRVPPEWLAQRGALAGLMSTDAPFDDLDLEPEDWDGDRFAEVQQITQDQNRRWVGTLVVHTATGTMVGATDLVLSLAEPDIAHQWDTLVIAGHRGRRLGMWIKAANLRALLAACPGVRRVVTGNAASNSPMLRVNDAMGFRRVGTYTEWQKRLDGD